MFIWAEYCTYEAWRQPDIGRLKLLTNESARKIIFAVLVDQLQSLKSAKSDITRSTSEIMMAVVFTLNIMMNLIRRCGWWEISTLDFSSGKAIISLLEIGRCMERWFANSGTSEGRSTEIGAEQAGHVDGGGGAAGGVGIGGQQDGA